ncbi:MAG: hypothetical protein AB2992_02360 [Candidatus Symbiodolus clandestinus]
MKTGKLAEINRSISEVFKGFFEAFPSAKCAGQKLETINIFIFNDKEDYQHLGGEVFKLGLGSGKKEKPIIGDDRLLIPIFIFISKEKHGIYSMN